MQQETALYFNIIPATFRNPASVIMQERCNSFFVINQGTTIAVVNGVVLNPGVAGTNNGESFIFGGNKGELFRGRVDISFPSGTGNVLTIQKVYLYANQLSGLI